MYVHRNRGEHTSRIAGIGTSLPGAPVTSEELEARIADAGIAVTPGFIERTTGIAARHFAPAGTNASDLATASARAALADAAVDATDVDVLMFAAASHDITEPATANIVQAKLGTRNAIVFDLKNACNSVLSALDVADTIIQSGRARVVLITAGEMPSRACNLAFTSRHDVQARFAHLTFGDAGGALVVTASSTVGRGIAGVASVSRGEAWELGAILSFGTMYPGSTHPDGAYVGSRSSELEAYGRLEVPGVIAAVLAAVEWKPADVDVVATHQHTARILYEITDAAGLPRRALSLPLRYTGNAASANVPLALAQARANGLLVPDARVLLVGAGAGFGATAMAVRW